MKQKLILYIIAAVVVLTAGYWLVNSLSHTEVTVDVDDEINLTPEQITSIKQIGEWEFLAVANEELVDMVRIYYGTVRLGINMRQVQPGWIRTQGDSIAVVLPKVGLLDRDFIDEGRTKSFFESGKWSHKDREALFNKAYRQMLDHCLTPENLQNARLNGEAQFRKMMRSMGYEHVSISWEGG